MTTDDICLSPFRPPLWKRTFDILLAGCAVVLAAPILVLCWLAVRLTSPGPALHWSRRVGKDNQIFLMPKFRTMRMDTPELATHLLERPGQYVTSTGRFLRKTSIDELPQLFSVLKGELSLIGPRPALFNQNDLVKLRTQAGVHRLVPGITGWAQVNGRDELEISVKVRHDAEYMKLQSLWFDLKILALTVTKVLQSEGIQH
jgi:O-antigen biosynthesis protein WbqP